MVDIKEAKDLAAADPTQLSNPFIKGYSFQLLVNVRKSLYVGKGYNPFIHEGSVWPNDI